MSPALGCRPAMPGAVAVAAFAPGMLTAPKRWAATYAAKASSAIAAKAQGSALEPPDTCVLPPDARFGVEPAAVPQRWQKRAPGVSAALQDAQVAPPDEAPHCEQNLPDTEEPHFGQSASVVDAELICEGERVYLRKGNAIPCAHDFLDIFSIVLSTFLALPPSSTTSACATMPTTLPRSSTMGIRRICSRPMRFMTESTSSSGRAVWTPLLMNCCTLPSAGNPSPTTRSAMSRSVITPRSLRELSFSTTGMSPTSRVLISSTALRMLSPAVTQAGSFVMISLARIDLLH